MRKTSHATLEMLTIVAKRLHPLLEDFVFVGGSTTGFFITDPATEMPRPTLDVDVIVEVLSRSEYYKLEDKLRALGFKNAPEHNLTCRWIVDEVLVDIMPTDPVLLGFANIWYTDAIQFSQKVEIEDDLFINVVTAPYFLATKIEAFRGRGNDDFLESKDIQDIITLMEGRKEINEEIRNSNEDLVAFIAAHFNDFLSNRDFNDYLPGHLTQDDTTDQRAKIILKKFGEIAELKTIDRL